MDMQHDAAWHLAEAERLLQMAADADENHAGSPRRWSYTERAQAHIALAAQLPQGRSPLQWLIPPGTDTDPAPATTGGTALGYPLPTTTPPPPPPARACELCGGPIRPASATGICRRNPQCKAESHRRSQKAHRQRINQIIQAARK